MPCGGGDVLLLDADRDGADLAEIAPGDLDDEDPGVGRLLRGGADRLAPEPGDDDRRRALGDEALDALQLLARVLGESKISASKPSSSARAWIDSFNVLW